MLIKNPVLIGYRGCGKTRVGRLLAELLGYTFADTDQLVEERCSARIHDLVAEQGWETFRQMESQVLESIIQIPGQVIATGGGIILNPDNRQCIRTCGYAVWLTADPDTLVQRLTDDTRGEASRPRFDKNLDLVTETRKILTERIPLYRETARFTLDTTRLDPEAIARAIESILTHGTNNA